MTKFAFLSTGVAAAGLLALSPLAAKPGGPGGVHGATTRTAVSSEVATQFARLDTNRDGFVTQAELTARADQRAEQIKARGEKRQASFDPAKMFARLDANKDGRVTKAEVEAVKPKGAAGKDGGKRADALFARVDTNKDGVVTLAEMNAAPKPDFAKRADRQANRIEKRMDGKDGMGARLIRTADVNKDGKVSLAEMQQGAIARFDRLDTNRDGTISAEEMKAARDQRMANRAARKGQ